MDDGRQDADAKIAQLSGDVQTLRAIVVGEANATAERLRAVERATGGIKTVIAAATFLILIGVAAVALALGQFLTTQMRAATADAARRPAPAAAPASLDVPAGSRAHRPARAR